MAQKPMNQFLKFILIAVGAFAGLVVVLLAAAAVIIPIKFPPEKLRSMASEKLSDALHHKVTIGDAHFNVLSGFKITDLKIANRMGWAEGPMVTAKEISISYELFPLLWGQIALGEVKINQPQILVERRGLDSFNFSDMMGDAPAPAAAPKVPAKKGIKPKAKPAKKAKRRAQIETTAEPSLVASLFVGQAWAGTAEAAPSQPSDTAKKLSVESVNILHGKVVYRDESVSPAQQYDLNDLNFKVKNISMVGGKTTYSLDTPFVYNKMPYHLSMAGAFRYFLASQSLKELKLDGKVNDLGFSVSGDALNMATDFAPTMDGDASLDMLKFSGLVPRSLSQMPPGLTLTGPAKVKFHLTGSVKKGLALSGTADATQLAIQYKDLFAKTNTTTCTVDFKSVISENGSYDLPSFKADYENWEVTGAFHHANGAPWSCEVHSKSLPFKGLPAMLPKLKNTTIDGAGSLDLKLVQSSKGALPFTVNGQIALKGVGITLPQEPYLQSMNGVIYCVNNLVRIPDLTFKSFDGTGAMGVTFDGNKSTYSYGFRLSNVNAQKAVDASIDAYVTKKDLTAYKSKLFGTMNLVYSGGGREFSGDAMMASQTGSGSYNLVDSKVKGLAAITAINKYFKDPSDEIKFQKVEGTLSMKNKVFSCTANTVGPVGAIRVAGGINADGVYAPDMKIQCDVKKDYINSDAVKSGLPAEVRGFVKDPGFLADENGNIPLDVKFTGPASQNNWTYDWGRLTNILKKKAQKAIEDVAKKGARNLGNQLKGLFGH